MHFQKGEKTIADAGMVAGKAIQPQYATQSHCPSNQVEVKGDRLRVHSKFYPINRRLPTSWQFLVLRCLNLSIMRLAGLREWIKRLLVGVLVTRKGKAVGSNLRVILFGPELSIKDEQKLPPGLKVRRADEFFSSIHMASRGYWQRQDGARMSGQPK